ncbi:hypothetical protein BDA99DRAFT_544574 [Phascolomyces articulosus]|uniref:Uncharacterized protein n=1 Tax=Phascolomyces articulosus TaxID=60185 RepID=A0AAD5JJZ7_9FUNG|nr:hypothetical protein BDA99DRAFT_544574 [Phascolomyces articulosus]
MEAEVEGSTLHSLQPRPSYSWSPIPFLTNVLSLDNPLFPKTMLPDEQQHKTIDKYPNIEGLQYQPLDTVPIAARKMNKYQSKQDMSLKRLQYLLLGVFRPMDVLGLKISQDVDNPNIQCYLLMLKDSRDLLLNAINPNFSSTASINNHHYTMSPNEFQAALVQQSTTTKAIKTASGFRSKRRPFHPTHPTGQ